MTSTGAEKRPAETTHIEAKSEECRGTSHYTLHEIYVFEKCLLRHNTMLHDQFRSKLAETAITL